MSTASSTSGQASHTRNSNVGTWSDGRTSKYAILASLMTPVPTSARTIRSYSSIDSKRPALPDVGHRSQIMVRMLAYPVSRPCQKGELADRASRIGSVSSTRLVSRAARSRSSTPT